MQALAVISFGLGTCLAAQAGTLFQFNRATASQPTLRGVGVLDDGQTMVVQVAASPEAGGGLLRFDNPRPADPQVVEVANFMGREGAQGGAASLSTRPDQHRKWLWQAPGTAYSVARAQPGSHIFVLQPLTLDNGSIIAGTLVTDGSVGPLEPARLLDWHIYAYHP